MRKFAEFWPNFEIALQALVLFHILYVCRWINLENLKMLHINTSIYLNTGVWRLDAQKEKLKKYAEFQGMVVSGEYSDEGKSGRNIEARPQLMQMLGGY